MTPEQKIEAEAKEQFRSISPGDMIHQITDSHYINKLRAAYIAGRSAGLEREKEYREGLSRAIKLLEDCLLNFEANELKQLLNK